MNLITGATGFLGSYLCRYLILQNEKVLALRRNAHIPPALQDIENRIDWLDCSLTDLDALNDALKTIKHVYHCAGKVSYLSKDRDEMFESNVEGTYNLTNLALKNKVEKFLFVSSISTLGATKEEFKSEATEWNEDGFYTQYAKSKYLAEKEVWRAAAEGLKSVIVNPAVILGAGDFKKSSLQIFDTVNKGLKYYTEGTTGYVDVRDVCKICYQLMQSQIHNERFVLTENNYSYKFIFDKIAEGLKVKAPSKIPTQFQAKVAMAFEGIKSKLFGSTPLITEETAKMAFAKNKFSNQKVAQKLNYKFIPIQKTIEESCKEFLSAQERNALANHLVF